MGIPSMLLLLLLSKANLLSFLYYKLIRATKCSFGVVNEVGSKANQPHMRYVSRVIKETRSCGQIGSYGTYLVPRMTSFGRQDYPEKMPGLTWQMLGQMPK